MEAFVRWVPEQTIAGRVISAMTANLSDGEIAALVEFLLAQNKAEAERFTVFYKGSLIYGGHSQGVRYRVDLLVDH